VFVDGAGNLVEAPPAYKPDDLDKRLDKIISFTRAMKLSAEDGMFSGTVILTPPDAGYIAPLPQRLARCYHNDEIAYRIHTAIESNEPDGAGIIYADLRERFASAHYQLYYRTDHHWNGDGAYLAYTALGGPLGFTPLPEDAFSVERIPDFYGSTYAKSGLWLTKPDIIELWAPPQPVRTTVMESGKEPETRDSIFFNEFLNDWDMYSVFLGGIRGLTVIDNLKPVGGGRTLLLIKDSYANSLIPMLIAHYDRIIAIDLRNYRGAVSDLYKEYLDNVSYSMLFVYSTDHIVNDPDLLWLR
jgi:hypothetical protein